MSIRFQELILAPLTLEAMLWLAKMDRQELRTLPNGAMHIFYSFLGIVIILNAISV
jgi:hypothetical protein